MFRRLALAGTIVLSLASLPSQPASSADQAVEQFYRLCLAEGPSLERMILSADPDWEPVAEAAFVADFAPIANPASVRVWLVTEAKEGLPAGTIIGVTKAQVDGIPVQTCTLAFPVVDQEAFRKSFLTRTGAEKIAEDRDTAQVSSFYTLFAGGR